MWIKRISGSGNIQLLSDAGTTAIASVSTSWQRFSKTETCVGGSYGGVGIATSGDVIAIWWPQQEDVTGQSNQNPSEYVSVGVLSAPFHGAGVDGVKYFSTLNGNTVASMSSPRRQGR